MELNKKEMYISPEAKTFEVKIEGVICGSGLRDSYGKANDGFDSSELDDSGNWIW